jgi:hypothetical protein
VGILQNCWHLKDWISHGSYGGPEFDGRFHKDLPRFEALMIAVRELEERAQRTFVSPYHLAYVYTGLGEADQAMDLLERAVADRTGATYSIKGSFLFAPLRGHPRFRALMRTMNLE